VIDANVLVAALLWRGPPHALLEHVRAGTVSMVSSPALVGEFADVIGLERSSGVPLEFILSPNTSYDSRSITAADAFEFEHLEIAPDRARLDCIGAPDRFSIAEVLADRRLHAIPVLFPVFVSAVAHVAAAALRVRTSAGPHQVSKKSAPAFRKASILDSL
jgi:hypothetical protein